MKKIEPCPHCDGVSKVRKYGTAYFVRCDDCGATSGKIYTNGGVSPAMVQAVVIAKWNRRVIEPWDLGAFK